MIVYIRDARLNELARKVNATGKAIGAPVPELRRVDATHTVTIWTQAVETPNV